MYVESKEANRKMRIINNVIPNEISRSIAIAFINEHALQKVLNNSYRLIYIVGKKDPTKSY
jgi:hypothetical protein